ncbi:MAG: putative lipid II flippase FtsW [Treponema sp.]|jgi:cell division protein FtsW|nr:putative lipid II flippase FtsW [Treponema sp.]
MFTVKKKGRQLHPDHLLVVSLFLLAGVGLVTLYSSSYMYAQNFLEDGLYLIVRQLMFLGLGLVLFLLASCINLDWIRSGNKPALLVLFLLVLCVLPFVPGVGVVKNGAARWFSIGGETFQPSELVKLVLPIYLAYIFDKKQSQIDSLSKTILPPFLISLLFVMLIILQNNFFTATFIMANVLVVFFLAGVKIRYFISAFVVMLPIAILLVLTKEHRFIRIFSYLNDGWDPHGAGYQVRASIMTIASGGLWGKGIGQGLRKLASVPEVQSDFIFASFSEETGFMGVLLFYAMFAFFAWRGYRVALKAPDMYRQLLGFSLVTTIVSQALCNIAVVSGSIPATGVPLPLFSSGGSSLTTTFISAGLLVNISRTAEKDESVSSEEVKFERKRESRSAWDMREEVRNARL